MELEDKTALEYGCGTGALTSKISPLFKTIRAKDLSIGMVEQAKKRTKELFCVSLYTIKERKEKDMSERVLIVGASKKEDRYAYKAQKMLTEHGHTVVPVHPTESSILGVDVISKIEEAEGEFDTATLYVRPQILRKELDQLIKLHPKRVIFNPGTEDSEIENLLKDAGIEPVKACTLVLLRSGQF